MAFGYRFMLPSASGGSAKSHSKPTLGGPSAVGLLSGGNSVSREPVGPLCRRICQVFKELLTVNDRLHCCTTVPLAPFRTIHRDSFHPNPQCRTCTRITCFMPKRLQ